MFFQKKKKHPFFSNLDEFYKLCNEKKFISVVYAPLHVRA